SGYPPASVGLASCPESRSDPASRLPDDASSCAPPVLVPCPPVLVPPVFTPMMIAPPVLLSPATAPVPPPPLPNPDDPPLPKLPSGRVAFRVQRPFAKHALATVALVRHVADSSALAQSASVLHSRVQKPQRQASSVPQTASESQLRNHFGF